MNCISPRPTRVTGPHVPSRSGTSGHSQQQSGLTQERPYTLVGGERTPTCDVLSLKLRPSVPRLPAPLPVPAQASAPTRTVTR